MTEPDARWTGPGLLGRFSALLGAHGFREALQTVFLILLARQSPGAYGEIMLAFSMGSVVLSVTEFGLNQHLISRLPLGTHDPGALLMAYTTLKGLVFCCTWFCVLAAAVGLGYSRDLTGLVMLVTTGLGMEAIAGSFFSFLRYLGRQREEGRIRVVAACVGFGYGFAMLAVRASCLFLGAFKLVESAFNAVLSIGRAWPDLPRRAACLPVTDVVRVARSSLVFVLIALTGILYNKLNAIVLHRVGGGELLAQYSASWSLVEGIGALVSNLMLGAVLFPVFARLHTEDGSRLTVLAQSAFKWLLLAALPITFAIMVESDRIIGLIYGPQYADAARLQPFLAMAIPMGFVHNLAVYLMLGTGQERSLLGIFTVGAVLCVVMCGLLIPAHPLGGSVAAILIVKGVVTVLTLSCCYRKISLFGVRDGGAVLVTALAMGILWWVAGWVWPREAAEGLSLIPPMLLAWGWHRAASRGRGTVRP